MRNLAIAITLFLLQTTLFAQDWPPIGAKWTFSFHSYPTNVNVPKYIECIGDTVIEGKSCRILEKGCDCGFLQSWAGFV